MAYKRFIILDRDGTIIEEVNYLSRVDQVSLIPGAVEAIKLLNAHGFGVIVVTNQSGVARGYFSAEDVDQVHEHLTRLLKEQGAVIEDVYYCPHEPGEDCACRKPRIGMLEQAFEGMEVRPQDCWVIGDKPCDVELGRRFGGKTIMVRTGHGKSMEEEGSQFADYVVDDLLQAVKLLLEKDQD